jgi:hypothetical protein
VFLSLCGIFIYTIKIGGARSAKRLPLKNCVISLDLKNEYLEEIIILLNSNAEIE